MGPEEDDTPGTGRQIVKLSTVRRQWERHASFSDGPREHAMVSHAITGMFSSPAYPDEGV